MISTKHQLAYLPDYLASKLNSPAPPSSCHPEGTVEGGELPAGDPSEWHGAGVTGA